MCLYAVCVFLLFCVFTTQGLECLHCRDLIINSTSLPEAAKLVLSKVEPAYRSPECKGATSASAAIDVTLNTCTGDPGPGQVNRCGRLFGSLKLAIDLSLLGRIEIPPVHLHIRGCFLVDDSLAGGCYSDKRILDQQKGVLSGILKGINFLDIGEFTGQLCVNSASNVEFYNANDSMKYSQNIIIIFFLVVVVLLFIY